ncbi:MAG: hypothetical protein R2877_07020 [Bdellovibrionota bacterium]
MTVPVLTTDPFQNIQDANAVDTDAPASSTLLANRLGSIIRVEPFSLREMMRITKTIFCWIKRAFADN